MEKKLKIIETCKRAVIRHTKARDEADKDKPALFDPSVFLFETFVMPENASNQHETLQKDWENPKSINEIHKDNEKSKAKIGSEFGSFFNETNMTCILKNLFKIMHIGSDATISDWAIIAFILFLNPHR